MHSFQGGQCQVDFVKHRGGGRDHITGDLVSLLHHVPVEFCAAY